MKLLSARSLVFATLLVSLAGCKPGDPVQPVDSTLETAVPPILLPARDSVYGAMYSIKVVHVFNGHVTKSEHASAVFYDNPSNTTTATEHANAGFVAVNAFTLNQGHDNEYDRTAIEGHIFEDLDFADSVYWVVQGDETVEPFTFAWSNRFPAFKGEFPAVITRKDGLSFTFDEASTPLADSVFVAIAAGDKLLVKRYPGDIGKVFIGADELGKLQTCSFSQPGYLQISACVDDIFTPDGKPRLMVKQTTEIRTVIIR